MQDIRPPQATKSKCHVPLSPKLKVYRPETLNGKRNPKTTQLKRKIICTKLLNSFSRFFMCLPQGQAQLSLHFMTWLIPNLACRVFQASWPWNHHTFQVPKCGNPEPNKAILGVGFPLHTAYIGEYLHFRYLQCWWKLIFLEAVWKDGGLGKHCHFKFPMIIHTLDGWMWDLNMHNEV